MQTESQVVSLIERAEALAWPLVVAGGGGISGERPWRDAARFSGNHASLSAQLDALEEQQSRSVAFEDRWAADAARREAAATPDPEIAEEARAEAAADFERHEREGPRRVEEKLAEIASSLREIVVALAKR